jgi:hypothetical protein
METPLSTWSTNFSAHAFHGSWERLVRIAEGQELAENVSGTQLADLLRMRKAIGFLSGLIESLDPELVPRNSWAACQSQVESAINSLTTYVSSRNEGHLISANDNVDVLLDALTRFGSDDARKRGVSVATIRSDDQITQITKRTVDTARSFQEEIQESRRAASEELAAIRKARTRAADYSAKLLEGSEAEPSVKAKIEAFLLDASKNAQEIKSFHAALIVGNANEESTQAQVKTAAAKITETYSQMSTMLDAVSGETEDLEAFHTKIFGDGKSDPGLKEELERRLRELREYEDAQRLRHKALSDQVEDLLPGAASAGLASSFRSMREEFVTPINTYTNVFYASILLMLVVALGSSIESVSIQPLALTLAKSADWTDSLRRLLERAPILLPLVWLAIFSATRRSQYERLQQEYAHKQALASSYESYKSQIKALGGDTETLLKELITRAIETVAFNASATLDGKHDQKMPIQTLLEKLSPSELEKVLEAVRAKKADT